MPRFIQLCFLISALLCSAPASALTQPPCGPGFASSYTGTKDGFLCVPIPPPVADITCPTGQAVTGFSGGQAVCGDLPAAATLQTTVLTGNGCDLDPDQTGFMTVSCPAGSFLLSCISLNASLQGITETTTSCTGQSWNLHQEPPVCFGQTIICGSAP